MLQSLVRKSSVADLVADYGQLIVDECHHLPAVQLERVSREVRARYVLGLTATPQRRDGHHPITEMQLGPVRFKVDAKSQAAARPFEHRLFVRETGFYASGLGDKLAIQDLYAALTRDEARNAMTSNDVVRALEDGRSPTLLTERKEHLEDFASRLAPVARHLVVLQGGMGAKADRAVRAQLDAIPPNEERLVLATGKYVGEGHRQRFDKLKREADDGAEWWVPFEEWVSPVTPGGEGHEPGGEDRQSLRGVMIALRTQARESFRRSATATGRERVANLGCASRAWQGDWMSEWRVAGGKEALRRPMLSWRPPIRSFGAAQARPRALPLPCCLRLRSML